MSPQSVAIETFRRIRERRQATAPRATWSSTSRRRSRCRWSFGTKTSATRWRTRSNIRIHVRVDPMIHPEKSRIEIVAASRRQTRTRARRRRTRGRAAARTPAERDLGRSRRRRPHRRSRKRGEQRRGTSRAFASSTSTTKRITSLPSSSRLPAREENARAATRKGDPTAAEQTQAAARTRRRRCAAGAGATADRHHDGHRRGRDAGQSRLASAKARRSRAIIIAEAQCSHRRGRRGRTSQEAPPARTARTRRTRSRGHRGGERRRHPASERGGTDRRRSTRAHGAGFGRRRRASTPAPPPRAAVAAARGQGIVPDRHIFAVTPTGAAHATGVTAPPEPSRAIAPMRMATPPAVEAPPPSLEGSGGRAARGETDAPPAFAAGCREGAGKRRCVQALPRRPKTKPRKRAKATGAPSAAKERARRASRVSKKPSPEPFSWSGARACRPDTGWRGASCSSRAGSPKLRCLVLRDDDIRRDAEMVDVAVVRREITRGRDLDRAAVAERKDRLHDALAERLRADDLPTLLSWIAPEVISEADAV